MLRIAAVARRVRRGITRRVEGALPTLHAPAEVAEPDVLAEDVEDVTTARFGPHLLDGISTPIVVTNPERQIVFTNRTAAATFHRDPSSIRGQRVGDLIGCAHLSETVSGCGTGASCRNCGLVNALLASADGQPAVRSARLLLESGEAIDAQVNVTPLEVGPVPFWMCEIHDVSAEQRRRQLERTFYHDVLNTAAGVKGLVGVGLETGFDSDPELGAALAQSSDALVEEIRLQQTVAAAENGDLVLHIVLTDPVEVLSSSISRVRSLADQRSVGLHPLVREALGPIETDPIVLGRVLGNLLKNAVEASEDGASVLATIAPRDDAVVFSVHNDGLIPEPVQQRLFHRSVSTKGSDRGIGAFSAKLLTERYLGGTIGFVSDQAHGTTFVVEIPRNPRASGTEDV